MGGRELRRSRQGVHGLVVHVPLHSIRNSKSKVTPELSSPGGLSLRFLHDRNIRIGILPEHEEFFVGSDRFSAISGSVQCSSQLEARHWPDGVIHCNSRLIQNLLKLFRGLAMTAQSGISEAPHVDGMESSEESAAVV